MRPRPIFLAALLATAIGAPLFRWWLAGLEATDRHVAALHARAREDAQRAASRAATQAAQQLEMLRQVESQRPWFHYQDWFHDPRALAQGIALTPSPLASGPTSPLILANVQIDAKARVRILERPGEEGRLGWLANVVAAAAPPCEAGPTARSEIIPETAFDQNARSLDYAVALQNAQPVAAPRGTSVAEVLTTSLQWTTVEGPEGPELMALRCVRAPDERRIQGFLVDRDAVEKLVGTNLHVRFVPGAPAGSGAPLPLPGVRWGVSVSDVALVQDAIGRGDAVRRQFRRNFALGATVAVLAGIAVAALAMQSERLARQRAAFAAAAAHELRTPLAALRLNAELLADGGADPEGMKRRARQVADEVGRLSRVVNNVLGATKLERGGLGARPVPGDLARCVGEIVERQRLALEAGGLSVRVEAERELPQALFDPEALAEILSNLLDNAARHAGTGAGCALVMVAKGEGGQHVIVSDEGSGVPERMRRAIFEPFVRGDARRDGLGLGLAIARALARAQGGDLELRATPSGARFVLSVSEA